MSFVGKVASRYIRSRNNRLVSFIGLVAIIGIGLGVATLIIVTCVMSGFSDTLRDKIVGASSDIFVYRATGGLIIDSANVVNMTKKNKNITAVSPFILSQVLLSTASGVQGVTIRGIKPYLENKTSEIDSFIINGNFAEVERKKFEQHYQTELSAKDEDATKLIPIAIGKHTAATLHVGIGSKITIVSPIGKRNAFGFMPKMANAIVVSIFSTGMYEYDTTLAYVDIDDIRNFLDVSGDAVNGFAVKTINIDNAAEYAKQIENALGDMFIARDWLSMNINLFSALQLERIVMFIVLTLIIIVASFNIMSVISITIKDKRKEIAILRAVGASQNQIVEIFVRYGLFIGAVGTIFGNIFALVVCFVLKNYKVIELPEDVYNMDRVPVDIIPSIFAIVSICSILIVFVASYIPSKQSIKGDIIDGLRHD